MRKTHDLVATIREYKDPQTGEMKKHRVNIGSKFLDDDGRESIKLDVVPCGPDWSGWISCYDYDPDRRRGEPRQGQGQGQGIRQASSNARTRQQPAPNPDDGFEDDDIPF